MSDMGKADGIAIALARLREAMEAAGMSGEFSLNMTSRDETIMRTLPSRFWTASYEPHVSDTWTQDGRVEPPKLYRTFAGVRVNCQ